MEIRAPRLLNLVLSIILVSTLCLPTNLAFADSVSEADSNTVTLVGSDADFEQEANEGDSELENASDGMVSDGTTSDNTVVADNDSLEDNQAVLISEAEKAAALQELSTPEEELGYVPGEMIVVYDETATEHEMAKAASAIDAELDSAAGDISAGTVSLVTISEDMTVATAIEAIEKDNAVVYAEPNYTVSLFDDDPVAFTQSNDAGYSKARDYLNAISAEQAWNYLATQSISTTRIASIDTGAKVDHEDLKNVLNLTLSKEIVATGEGANRKTTFEKLQGDGLVNGKIHSTITSSSTHGTHVAGIMAAQSNNGVGSAGVASGGSTKYSNKIVDLFAIDAFNGVSSDNKETANIYDVVSAMQYAKNNKARVVNLSLGLFEDSSTLQTACKDLYTNNVVMVCAAGNYNSTQKVYPAAYDTTIAVINCKNDGSRATYDSGAGGSTYGTWCDVAAPGYQIYSTTSSSTSAYGYLTGTSMAAPVVSSAAAMMIAVNPSLTPSGVKTILTETARNTQKNEQTAWGMINAEKAVKEAVATKTGTGQSQIGASTDVSKATITGVNASYTYTGSAVSPVPTVRIGTKTLVKNKDYTLTYSNNNRLGTAQVIIKGMGSYSGVKTVSFTIKAANAVDELAIKNKSVIADGVYSIKSLGSSVHVLDVSGGSTSNGANVQLYANNYSGAQKWRVTHDALGYITLTNVQSGKVLDVAGGKSTRGTNVQQYQSNGSKAQKWIAVKSGSGFIVRSALNTNMVLDISGGKFANKSNVQIYTANNTNAQKFVFASIPQMADIKQGTYIISSALGNNQVLDISGARLTNGGNAQIYASNGTAAQKWYVRPAGSGYYTLQNVNSGMYLGVNGSNVCQQPLQGDATKWVIIASGAKYVLSNAATGKVLDVSGAKKSSGTNVQVYVSNSSAAQQWTFAATDLFTPGVYTVVTAVNPNYALDVSGASKANGAPITLYSRNGTAAQKFRISKNSDGTYTFININSGKVIDIPGASKVNGKAIQQYTSNGTAAQHWKISIGSRGFVLTSPLGKTLDVSGAKAYNKAKVQTYSPNGTLAQCWLLVKS